MRISFWKCCVWGLPLSLMATALMGGDAPKSANARTANRTVSRAPQSDSMEDLFDAHLISRSQESAAELIAPPPTALGEMPKCCDYGQMPSGSLANPNPNAPSTSPTMTPDSAMPSQQFGSLSAGQGILTAQNDAPAFLGDFFSSASCTPICGLNGEQIFPSGLKVLTPGANVGTMKLAENTSPIPRDRFFLSYNYFNNVPIVPGTAEVQRLTPGLEKTFFDGRTSIEVRAPMAWTLNSTVNSLSNPADSTGDFELGNVTTFFKALLYRSDELAVSAGLGVTIPTADKTRITDGTTTLIAIKNQSVHLLPFVGAVYTPNDRWYCQSLMQLDIDTNGNPVIVGGENIGRFHDANFLFASASTGYWILKDADPSSWVNGLAQFVEIHTNWSITSTDVVEGNGVCIGNATNTQTVNAVIGLHALLDQNKTLTVGYATPLGRSADRGFDGEFRLLFNWFYGAQPNRQQRVQF